MDDQSVDELLEHLKNNKKRGVSSAHHDELVGYETFGNLSYYEFPYRHGIEVADPRKGNLERIAAPKGNSSNFWSTVEYWLLGDGSLNQYVVEHYSSSTNTSGDRKAEELKVIADEAGRPRDYLKQDLIELAVHSDQTYLSEGDFYDGPALLYRLT